MSNYGDYDNRMPNAPDPSLGSQKAGKKKSESGKKIADVFQRINPFKSSDSKKAGKKITVAGQKAAPSRRIHPSSSNVSSQGEAKHKTEEGNIDYSDALRRMREMDDALDKRRAQEDEIRKSKKGEPPNPTDPRKGSMGWWDD